MILFTSLMPRHKPVRRFLPAAIAAALLIPLHASPAQTGVAGAPLHRAGDECGPGEAKDEILVCGKRPTRSPYRLPPQDDRFDPWGTVESVRRERARLLEGGEAGIHSCSPVGPGGWTGCDLKVIKMAEQQGKRAGIGARKPRASIGLQVGRIYAGTDRVGRVGQ